MQSEWISLFLINFVKDYLDQLLTSCPCHSLQEKSYKAKMLVETNYVWLLKNLKWNAERKKIEKELTMNEKIKGNKK